MTYYKYDGSAAADTALPVVDFFGAAGAETLSGTAGANSLWVGVGDVAQGGLGDDTYWVQAVKGQFSISEAANAGIDKVAGWQSINLNDYPNFENVFVGGDKTYGAGNGADNIIEGGAGAQQIYGGGGQDILIGGAGGDTFIIVKGEGNDVVQDFNAAEDVVRLNAGYTSFAQVQSHLSQAGADVKLDLGGGDAVLFRNATVGQFTAANFQLPLNPASLGAMTFHDEFSGALSIWDPESNPTGTWRPDFGYQGVNGTGSYTLMSNDEKQIYTSPYFRGHNGDFAESPFSTGDGALTITAKPSANGELFGYGYTSGMITTQPTFSQTYGYFEMRADLPDAQGAWPAFWLIPADGSWPPELDIMETLTSDPNGTWTTEHSGVGGNHTSNGMLSFVPDTADGFHTYGALWTASTITWFIDGVQVFQQATPADMNKPMFMIANLALGGWGGAIDNTDLPAQLKIDYIRAYALGDTTATPTVAPPAPVTTTPPPVVAPPVVAPPADAPVETATGAAGVSLSWSVNGDSLAGGAGADTINASQGADRLTGGAGADLFVFKAMPWSAGKISDFQVGTDKLDISGLYAGGYHGADPVADGYVRFESDGAGGTKVMVDIDGAGTANPWAFHVVTLAGVSPTGLTAGQVFGQATAALPVQPAPAPAAPAAPVAPVAPAAPAGAGVVVTSTQYADTLTGGAGGDTLNAGQGPDRMVGGAGADTFAFKALPWNAGHITDFQVGVDKLDFSTLYLGGYHGTDPVADGYVRFESDGAGGTKVMLDIDGAANSANPWAYTMVTLDGVSPTGLTAAKVFDGAPPPPAGVTLTSTGYGETLTGGAGADTLNAAQGPDRLVGGAGADHFVFGNLPWNAGHVADFQHGVDVIDLRPLFAAAGYTGSDPIADGYVRFESDGVGGTVVKFDQDGPGTANPWPTTITTLDGVAPSTLTASDWLFH